MYVEDNDTSIIVVIIIYGMEYAVGQSILWLNCTIYWLGLSQGRIQDLGLGGRHEYQKGKGSGDRFLPPPVGPGRSHVLGSFDHQNGKCIIHTKTLKLCIIEYIWRAKRTSELSKIVLERVGVHNPNGIPFAARVHVC